MYVYSSGRSGRSGNTSETVSLKNKTGLNRLGIVIFLFCSEKIPVTFVYQLTCAAYLCMINNGHYLYLTNQNFKLLLIVKNITVLKKGA